MHGPAAARLASCQPAVSARAQAPVQQRRGPPFPTKEEPMSKLTRGLVLGAMLAVLSSATAAAAPPQQPLSRNEAVRQFRAGERASMGQPVSHDQAVQQFRAGERASAGQPVSRDDVVQRFRAGERAALQLTSDKAPER